MTHFFKKASSIAIAAGATLAFAIPMSALAATVNASDLGVSPALGGSLGLGGGDLRATIGAIIKVALSFLGIIALCIVLLGGFKYMVAGGDDEKTSEAKQLIVSAIIGLAIILSAWAITTFVVSNLITATTTV